MICSLGAPALRGTLLEEAERVPVAVVDVAQRRLLEAVASAIVTARSGSSRVVPTAEIVAAFAACSGVNSYAVAVAAGRTRPCSAAGPCRR